MDAPRPIGQIEVKLATPKAGESNLPMVVVGASAGGLTALEEFLNCIPLSIDAAIVVIQHLSPDYKSFLDQLLQRHTQLNVRSMEDGMLVETKTVYVLPPNMEAIVCQNRLLLTERSSMRNVIYPIDDFLRSLAHETRKHSIGVIFSGTGTDGSRGVRELHSARGFVIAQSPETAAFSGMPRSAISTGIVDLVLSPREAAKAIVRKLDRHAEVPDVVEERDSGRGFGALDLELEMVLGTLRLRLGIDYNDYQSTVVCEAVHRRQNATGLIKPTAYAELLLRDDNEASHFFAALMGNARSQFFCDDELYEQLALDVVPTLLANIPYDQDFRAWVIGCGTGEEVYTLAILLAEWYEQKGLVQRVKIFASDVHAESLSIASKAVYQADALAQISPARLEKFFIERPDGFHVVPELRKMVVFTPHNCLREAPFTRMDLVWCRHLLRRFSRAAHLKAIGFIHFALRDNGVLIVHPDTRMDEFSQEFDGLSPENGVFIKQRLVGAQVTNSLARMGRDHQASRLWVTMSSSLNCRNCSGIYFIPHPSGQSEAHYAHPLSQTESGNRISKPWRADRSRQNSRQYRLLGYRRAQGDRDPAR